MKYLVIGASIFAGASLLSSLPHIRASAQVGSPPATPTPPSLVCYGESKLKNLTQGSGWTSSIDQTGGTTVLDPVSGLPTSWYWIASLQGASLPNTTSVSGTISDTVTNNTGGSSASICGADCEALGEEDYGTNGSCSSSISFLSGGPNKQENGNAPDNMPYDSTLPESLVTYSVPNGGTWPWTGTTSGAATVTSAP